MMNKSGQDTYAKEMVEQFDIRPADYNLPTSSLSGGNAQKGRSSPGGISWQ